MTLADVMVNFLDLLNNLSNPIMAFATVAIGVFTYTMYRENKRLRQLTEDEPILEVINSVTRLQLVNNSRRNMAIELIYVFPSDKKLKNIWCSIADKLMYPLRLSVFRDRFRGRPILQPLEDLVLYQKVDTATNKWLAMFVDGKTGKNYPYANFFSEPDTSSENYKLAIFFFYPGSSSSRYLLLADINKKEPIPLKKELYAIKDFSPRGLFFIKEE